ncbi:MAG: glycosyltransferase family 39 protein [Bdellovibrionales bacterium]|nr:glycosyltransferase family 39 protein [Bdellovibrionales bacterium]
MLTIKNLFVFSFVLKLIIGVLLPLSPDEAYYWVWGQKLQLSYFDHPAFVAWLNLLGQPFESIGSGIRIPGMIMSHATLGIWLLLLRDLLTRTQLLSFLTLMLCLPFTGAGGMIVTPDIPLMFFWSLTLLLVKTANKSQKVSDAFLAGLALGLGFVSKYTMILILPVILFWMFSSKKSWRQFSQFVAVGVVGSLITSFPVWYWNLTNDLTSVGFQLSHGFSDKFKIENPIEYLLGQVAFLFPTTVFFAYKSRHLAPSWLLFAALWPLGFFGFASIFANSEVNWPIVAHPAVMAIALLGVQNQLASWVKWTSLIFATLVVLVILEVFFTWIPSDRQEIRTDVFRKFNRVAEYVKDKENIYARSYQMASAVSYANKKMFFKLRHMNRTDVFDFWPESLPKENEFDLIMRRGERFKRTIRDKYKAVSRQKIDDQFDVVRVQKQ